MSGPKLTVKQRKFIEVYNGNATDAARQAGYSGNDNALGVTGHELLRNPKIAEIIKSRDQQSTNAKIATKEERQAFWTRVMSDENADMSDRLQASKILGQSQGDFITKVEATGKNVVIREVSEDTPQEREERLKRIEQYASILEKLKESRTTTM